MSSNISISLANRAPKKPIKKLPAKIEVPKDATVEDAKKVVARQSGISDFNRIGLYDAAGSLLKDRKALIRDLDTTSLQVKNLGPQASWRTVYMIEYAGPIVFHAIIPFIRPYIYLLPPYVYKNEAETPMSQVQWLLFFLFTFHFIKRELETVFVHKFAANTMPAANIFWNSLFYWALAGLLSGLHIYAPGTFSDRNELELLDYVGLGLFVFGEVFNFNVHVHLSQLRSRGGTEKGIPSCFGSSLVTCPNYMFEIIAWIGVILICRSVAVVAFIAVGTYYMKDWSKDKEKALRAQFPDKYKPKSYYTFPGLF